MKTEDASKIFVDYSKNQLTHATFKPRPALEIWIIFSIFFL